MASPWAASGREHAVAAAHDADIDEELLLEETEMLLSALHPIAYLPTAAAAALPEPEPLYSTSPRPLFPLGLNLDVDLELKCPSTPLSSTDSNDSSGSSSPSSPPSSISSRSSERDTPSSAIATTTRPSANRGPKRNLSRERMQNELRELRALVGRLEHELQMKRHAQRAIVSHQAWEGIAKRQRRQRERAEAELRRLKARVAAQDMLAVEMLYKWKRSMMTPVTVPSRGSVLAVPRLCFSAHDASILQVLLADLDVAYSRTQAVFHDAGVDDSHSEPSISVTEKPLPCARDGSPRSFLEVVHIDASPFDFATQRSVAWSCMKHLQLARNETIQFPLKAHVGSISGEFEDDGNTFAVKQRIQSSYDGGSAVINYLFAMRRYRAASHEVWIWRGVTKSEQYMRDLYVKETGWIVVSPLAAHGATRASGWSGDVQYAAPPLVGTVQRTCAHYETKPLGGGRLDCIQSVADQLSTLVVTGDENVGAELSVMVESAVLDEHTRDSRESEIGADSGVMWVEQSE